MGIANFACGYYTGDGTQGQLVIPIGFTPRYVKLMNVTDLLFYEFFEGINAAAGDTDNDDTYLTTGSSGDITVDDNTAIQTNASIVTATEMALNVPGSSSADLGTTGTTTVTFVKYDNTQPRLAFNAGSSGAVTNVNSKVYYWMALG